MKKSAAIWGSIFGFLAVLLGAFASHLLKNHLSPIQIDSFEIGVRYQIYHAFFLLFLAVQNFLTNSKYKLIKYLTIVGVFLFSGSIYILALKDLLAFKPKFFVFLTPLGGTSLLMAWLILIINLLNNRNKK
jgi:uncharacterized membrane protein YgdD (TMEM256/DUF423 family)